jgi:hypothetical protein
LKNLRFLRTLAIDLYPHFVLARRSVNTQCAPENAMTGTSITEAEARAISGRVAKVMRDFAATIAAPLYWPAHDARGSLKARNGSAFFVETRERLFGITAAHVIEGGNGWRQHCQRHGRTRLRLGGRSGTSIELDWDQRRLDVNLDMDIATFSVSRNEVLELGRTVYQGFQRKWPPAPPERHQGIGYAGYAAVETKLLARDAVEFGFLYGGGLVSSVSETTVSTLIERPFIQPIPGGEALPPEGYNFGGISGGPMLSNQITSGGVLVNALAGVVVSRPRSWSWNTSCT